MERVGLKHRIRILSILLLSLSCILASLPFNIEAQEIGPTIQRTLYSNIYHFPNGTSIVYQSHNFVNYFNGDDFLPINSMIAPSNDPLYDWMITEGIYQVYFKENPSTAETVKFWYDSSQMGAQPHKVGYATYQPMFLNYRNAYDSVQQIATVYDYSVTGFPNGSVMVYDGIFGDGYALQYEYLAHKLKETLKVADRLILPEPEQYIVDGGDVTMDLDFLFTFDSELDIYVEGELWDKGTRRTTYDKIEFYRDNDFLFELSQPYAYDSYVKHVEGSTYYLPSTAVCRYEIKKQGGKLWVNIKVPYEWLNSIERVFPVFIDPTSNILPEGDGTYSEWLIYPGSGDEGLYVDSFDDSRGGWEKVGVSPYLDATDDNRVKTDGNDGDDCGNFGFEDTTRSIETITAVYLDITVWQEGEGETITPYIYNGSWVQLETRTPVVWGGPPQPPPDGMTLQWDVSGTLDTWTKINNAQLYFMYASTGASDYVIADVSYIYVEWTSGTHYDKVDDPVGSPDDDTTRVETPYNTNWVKDLYEIENFTLPSGNQIDQIELFYRARGEGFRLNPENPHCKHLIRTYDTDYSYDEFAFDNNTWVNLTYTLTTNPNTGSAWTESEINALQSGVYGQTKEFEYMEETWWNVVQVTQVYVKITYSEAEKEFDCNWIGINNTLAGEPTKFSSDWTDLNVSEGLSHNRFCTNNTGTWVNDTWTDSWENVVWAVATKTLNGTSDLIIAFKFYVNDTSGTEYASTICFFKTLGFSPVARFTYSPFIPAKGQNVTFDASTSVTVSGSITSYSWNFGDGNNSTGITAYNVFVSEGLYSVNLTVTNSFGKTDWIVEKVYVVASSGHSVPATTEIITPDIMFKSMLEKEPMTVLDYVYGTMEINLTLFLTNRRETNIHLDVEIILLSGNTTVAKRTDHIFLLRGKEAIATYNFTVAISDSPMDLLHNPCKSYELNIYVSYDDKARIETSYPITVGRTTVFLRWLPLFIGVACAILIGVWWLRRPKVIELDEKTYRRLSRSF